MTVSKEGAGDARAAHQLGRAAGATGASATARYSAPAHDQLVTETRERRVEHLPVLDESDVTEEVAANVRSAPGG